MDLEQALEDEIDRDIEDYCFDNGLKFKSEEELQERARIDVCEDWIMKVEDISPALADWIEWNYLSDVYPTKNNMFNPKFGTEGPINEVKEE